MFSFLKSARLHKWWFLSLPLLYLGFIGATSGKWPLNWVWMVVFSALGLAVQFGGWQVLRDTMKPIKRSDLGPILISIILAFVLSLGASALGDMLGFSAVANANTKVTGSLFFRIWHIAKVSFSLIGEELITAAFTFPIFVYFRHRLGDKQSWFIASVTGALLFGLLHMPIYHGNLWQVLVATGLGRLPFNWVWRKTDTLQAGIWAHILYDLVIFIPTLIIFYK